MPKPRIDFGGLTTEETITLATDVLAELTLSERIQVVLKAFEHADEKDELLEWLAGDEE